MAFVKYIALFEALASTTRASIAPFFQYNNTSANNINEDICTIWTVVEAPIVIRTCFSSNTVVIIESCTGLHITNAPICISTTITASSTLDQVSPSDSAVLTSRYLDLIFVDAVI